MVMAWPWRRLGGRRRIWAALDGSLGSEDGADALGEVANVVVAALGAQRLEGVVEVEEVLGVEAAGADRVADVGGEGLRVLRADELVVVRGADVDEGADGRGLGLSLAVGVDIGFGGSGVEGRVMDGVAVDFANVQVVLDLGHLFGEDAVGDAPDAVGSGAVVVV